MDHEYEIRFHATRQTVSHVPTPFHFRRLQWYRYDHHHQQFQANRAVVAIVRTRDVLRSTTSGEEHGGREKEKKTEKKCWKQVEWQQWRPKRQKQRLSQMSR